MPIWNHVMTIRNNFLFWMNLKPFSEVTFLKTGILSRRKARHVSPSWFGIGWIVLSVMTVTCLYWFVYLFVDLFIFVSKYCSVVITFLSGHIYLLLKVTGFILTSIGTSLLCPVTLHKFVANKNAAVIPCCALSLSFQSFVHYSAKWQCANLVVFTPGLGIHSACMPEALSLCCIYMLHLIQQVD